MKYKQCLLCKNIKEGVVNTVSWIPVKYAQLNKSLQLKENGNWISGWFVSKIGSTELDESQLPDFRKDIRRHRKSTGDSLKW